MAIDREKVLAAAQKYVEKKKYDKAVIEYERIIQEDPNDARTLLKMGDLQLKMEGYAAAVSTYERVGKFYAQQGFSLKAIAVYKQIREIIGRHVPTLEDKYAHIAPKLAELFQQLGLTSDALAALDEVATRLQRQNRDQEAIEVFRKIVDLDATNPLPHLRLAEALSRAKDIDGAVLEFGIAAGQLAKLGRREDAIKVIERLLHHKPDIVQARAAAELYLAKGTASDGMQALAKLQICFQANPRDLDTLGLLARAFTQIGQAAKAIEVQKEMARIARDTGKTDLFRELVAKLMKLAPNDEGVKRLASGSTVPPSVAPAARASSLPPQRSVAESEPESSASYEDVGESDIESDEQPLELRRSAAPRADADVLVESGYDEVVEEVHEPTTAAGSHAQIARILTDAASLRDSGMHVKAIEALRIGLEIAPKSIEAHQMLRDVLLEMGRTAQAVAQIIQMAALLVEGLDGEGAARMLQEALSLEPENAAATKMLRELGYELVEEPEDSGLSSRDSQDDEGRTAIGQPYDPEAPLPSYDLEEIGPEDVARRSYPEQSVHGAAAAPAPNRSLEGIDDPFGEPLPSFPLESGPRERGGVRSAWRRGPGACPRRAAPRPRSLAEGRPAGARVGARRGGVLRFARPLRRRPHHSQRAARAPAEQPPPAGAVDGARRAGAWDAGRFGHAAVALRGRRCHGRPCVRHRRVTPQRRGSRERRRRRAGRRRADRPGRRRGGLREVQGGGRRADRRRRRAEPLRPRRRLQGDGSRRRRPSRVRSGGARREARVRLPVDDRDDPHRARQPQRGDRRLHARAAEPGANEGPGGGAVLRGRRGVRGQEDDQAGARLLPARRSPHPVVPRHAGARSGGSRRWNRSSPCARSPWAPTTSSTERSTTSSARARASSRSEQLLDVGVGIGFERAEGVGA